MATRGEVTLGDDAKDTITGLTGVVVAITDWLAGCQRITIQPRELKDGKPVENSTFDVEQVEVVKSVRQRVTDAAGRWTGGPHDPPTRAADVR
jgi:hypothetical protein